MFLKKMTLFVLKMILRVVLLLVLALVFALRCLSELALHIGAIVVVLGAGFLMETLDRAASFLMIAAF